MLPPHQQLTFNPARDDLVTAVLRLVRPLPSHFGRATILDIRSFASDIDLATMLFQSIQHDSTHIAITPTPTISDHGILHIDLDISPQIGDVDGADEREL